MIWLGFAAFLAGVCTAFVFFANGMRSSPGQFKGRSLIVAVWVVVVILALVVAAKAHDHSRPGLDSWYPTLRSPAGSPCCDGPSVDAVHLADVDWESREGRYRVRIDGEWIDVPPGAVLTGPNRDGRTLVWPTWSDGKRAIRCFMPGAMT